MVKAKRKPLEEIKEAISGYTHILNIGCGGCVSVCLAGGQREVNELNMVLKLHNKKDKTSQRIEGYTVERQCNETFLEELESMISPYDCIISMACGAGVQNLAARFPGIPIFPAVNTMAIGIDRDLGMYEEKCKACGHCVLGYTGGICPVTRCAKSLFNGPCGSPKNGMCEISAQVPCAWYDIYTRLKEQNRLDDIRKIQPPMEWQNQTPRTIIQEAYEKRYRI